jgi:NAD(P)-dependent dehydrogenase (short-subunit alcohol dehydrogenase family)
MPAADGGKRWIQVEFPVAMDDKWTTAQIPDQTGRVALVTGANSGLGLVTARELARAGAQVVMGCRNEVKGREAVRAVDVRAPGAEVELESLDLANLDSVRGFAERVRERHPAIDLLINNAGVMAPPRRETADGFELQLGTNHLGHFALTALLLEALEGREDARVVTLSSNAHKGGRIAFGNLGGERHYFRWSAYSQSKLANLMFALELDRRLRAAGSGVKSLAAHPGWSATNLQSSGPPKLDALLMVPMNRFLAQNDEMGALPVLYAATAPGLEGGTYIGPDGAGEMRGYPRPVSPSRTARNEEQARRLWEVSEELTGVRIEPKATA